jgi:hypothetical protein
MLLEEAILRVTYMWNLKEVFQMLNTYSYQAALAASESIHWRVEDIIGGEKRLDFTRHFMPESLAQTEALSFFNKGRETNPEPDQRQRLPLHLRARGRIYTAIRPGPCAIAIAG